MDAEIYNRIGIVANFFAAFLLAPEIIGPARFQRLSEFLEGKSGALDAQSQIIKKRAKEKGRSFITELLTGDPTDNEHNVKVLLYGLWVILLFVLSLLLKIVSYQLGIKNRFRALIVLIGILLFVIGSVSSFLGTFKPQPSEAHQSEIISTESAQ